MAEQPFSAYAAPTPEPSSDGIRVQSGQPPVIPINGPGAGGSQDGGGVGPSAGGWRKLAGMEKFKDEQALAESYLELQRSNGRASNEVNQLRQFREEVLPYLPLLEEILAKQEEESEVNNRGRGRQQPGADPMISQKLAAMEQQIAQATERQQRMAINTAVQSFVQTSPESANIVEEVIGLIQSDPPVIAIADYTDPQQVLKGLEAAAAIVLQSKSARQKAGKAASSVAGGSAEEHSIGGVDLKDPRVTAADVLSLIKQRQ